MMMRHRLAVVSLAVLVVAGVLATARATEPDWYGEARVVHDTYNIRNISGSGLTIARFGDDITYNGAFFKPFLHHWNFTNLTADEEDALAWLKSFLQPDCWNWQEGPDASAQAHGCMNGATSAWPLARDQAWPARNIDTWLTNLKPEVAVILFGTNDLTYGDCAFSYKQRMRQITQACKDYGTIPILVTIPPRMGYEAQTVGEYPGSGGTGARGTYVQAVIDLAAELKVPLMDYNKEILDRRPTDWHMTLIPGPDATQVPPGDGVHPSAAVAGYPDDESWRQGYDFSATYLNKWGYTLLNWMTLHAIWDFQRPFSGWYMVGCWQPVKMYDTRSSDVPGPQPIRVFPIPAWAVAEDPVWEDGQIAYDNSAEGLTFSTVSGPPYDSNVALPIIKPNIVIHGVHQPFRGEPYIDSNANRRYDAGEPFTDVDGDGAYTPMMRVSADNAMIVDNTGGFYVTQEGSDSDPPRDNRFPCHVPRLARSHYESYLSVLFDLSAQPVKRFGVFLPAASNNWTNDPPYVQDDQNFVKQDRSVYVTMVDESGWPMSMYWSLKVGSDGAYCPFLSVQWDGVFPIRQVSIIHDLWEDTNKGVSFMDVYTVPAETSPVILPATPSNPGPADLAAAPRRFMVLDWESAGLSFDVYLDTVNPPLRKVATTRRTVYGTGLLAEATTYYWQVVANGTTGQIAGPVWSFQTRSFGDVDSNGHVNVGDLQLLVVAWAGHETPMTCNWNPAADANIDGHVNVGDLQLLVQDWGR